MIRSIRVLVGLALVGAIGAVLVMFIYQAYVLISRGVPRDKLPVDQMLLEVMNLDTWAVLGAGAGLVLGVLVLLGGAISGALGGRRARQKGPAYDPHQIIQSQREQVADEYLAKRREEAAGGAG